MAMSDAELVINEVRTLSPDCLREVLDFIGYIKLKHSRETGIGAEDPTPNALTIAAMEEGDAMLRGEIPANRFNSFEEMLEALKG
jgi:hypothetical protein